MINNNSYNYNNIHGKKAKSRNKNYGQPFTSLGCIFFLPVIKLLRMHG